MSDEHRDVIRPFPASAYKGGKVTCDRCCHVLRGDAKVFEIECTYPAGFYGRVADGETKGFKYLCEDCYKREDPK
jgi:hypothetical protein